MKKPFLTAAMRRACRAFTLVEMLISIAVLTLIILIVTQLATYSAAVSRSGSKHIDTDTQGRVVLDRMAIDFAQMLKRSDVDCYLKGPTNYNGHGNGHAYGKKVQTGQQGSDQIAFFGQAPGYNQATGTPSPISLVAYRVNQSTSANPSYLMLERLGKGLPWNGSTNASNNNFAYPIVFLDSASPPTMTIANIWPYAVKNDSSNNSKDSAYETVGPGVLRFEYYYLLKNGTLTDVPWDKNARPAQTTLTNPVRIGLIDVQAIVVTFAAIDPASRALINAAGATSLFDLASDMADFKTAPGRGVGGAKKTGDLENYWKGVLFGDAGLGLPGVVNTGLTSNNTPVPPAAASAIRIYSRYIDLRTF